MKHHAILIVPTLVLLAVACLLFVTFSAEAPSGISDARPVDTSTRTATIVACPPGWSVVPNPHKSASSLFSGVAVHSANDVWAVGSSGPFTASQTLRQHWDGTTWSIVPGPDAGTGSSLASVATMSANDVWAVGYFFSGLAYETLIEHWDGSAWAIVPSPVLTEGGILASVAALSVNNAWAVGNRTSSQSIYVNETLVEHWNGTEWSVVPSPNIGPNSNYLFGVGVLSPDDIWAVGSYYIGSVSLTLVEHWDGTSWSVVQSPNVGTAWNSLFDIAAVSANDAWAVGEYGNAGGQTTHTLIEHWNGTTWSVVPSPEPAPFGRNSLRALAATAPNDLWTVGFYNTSGTSLTLVMHWDGTTWSVVPSPNNGTAGSVFTGVAAVGANDLWAVGDYQDSGAAQALTEHYVAPCASPTPNFSPTVTPSNTPAALLVGHVTWQGPPTQPNTRQQLPITLTLRLSSDPDIDYTALTTDPSGFFTVTVSGLTHGTYSWRAKGPKYLSTCGMVTLSGAPTTQQEMGVQRAGDTDSSHDNMVNASDLAAMVAVFGSTSTIGDLNNDGVTNTFDFNLLRDNFGIPGCNPLVHP